MYFASPGRSTDTDLQLGKACYLYTPANFVCVWGVYCFHIVPPSVRPQGRMYTCVFQNYGHFSVFQLDLFHRHTSRLICVSKIMYKVPLCA